MKRWRSLVPSCNVYRPKLQWQNIICLGFLCIKNIIHSSWMINRTNSDSVCVISLFETKQIKKYLSLYCSTNRRTPDHLVISGISNLLEIWRTFDVWRSMILFLYFLCSPSQRYVTFYFKKSDSYCSFCNLLNGFKVSGAKFKEQF